MPLILAENISSTADSLFAAMLDQSQDCVKLITPQGQVAFMNNNGMKAMDIEKFEQVSGKKWIELWPETGRAQLIDSIEHAKLGMKSRFTGYCPTLSGEPRWWDVAVSPIFANGDDSLMYILVTSRDISLHFAEIMAEREARRRAEIHAEQSEIISIEMRHRLKNLLAVISSIATFSARGRTNISEYLDIFLTRLRAFGHSQDLLTKALTQPVSIKDACRTLLQSNAADTVTLNALPEAHLDKASLQTLALIINELVTNARKYGALSSTGGEIAIDATTENGKALMTWKEQWLSPQSVEGIKPGSGHDLMHRMARVAGQIFDIEWHENGLNVIFSINLEELEQTG